MESLIKRVPEFELPVKEHPEYLGTSLAAMRAGDVPNHSDMLRKVLTEMGWGNTRFDIYRVRVPYPIMHSVIYLRVAVWEQTSCPVQQSVD